jgi:MFS family permease
MRRATPVFHGWRVVAACFVIAAFAWALGLFGGSVYLQSVSAHHGWPIAQVASAITLFFLVSAAAQRSVGRAIDRHGPRPVLSAGVLSIGTGVALIGQVREPWQLYPCFVLVGLGWSSLSTTALSATVAPWFERHQGRSMTLAIMGASVGSIVGVPLLLMAIARLGLAAGLALAGLVAALVLLPLIAVVLRHRGPAALGLARDGDRLPGAADGRAPAVDTAAAADAVGEAVPPALSLPPAPPEPLAARGRPAWLLGSATAGFALGLLVQIGFITHHVALARPALGLAGAGLLVSATGLAALLGRIVLARIVDRVDVRRLATRIMVVQTLVMALLAIGPATPALVAASLVYGWCIGHVTTLGPIVVRREFGAAAFGATYGSAATLIQFVAATGPALFGWLRDAFDGYGVALGVAAVLSGLGAAALAVGGRIGGRRG